MKKLINRILADTPGYFKRVIAFAITIASICGGVLAAHETGTITIGDTLHQWCEYGVAAGVIAGLIAKTAVQNTDDI